MSYFIADPAYGKVKLSEDEFMESWLNDKYGSQTRIWNRIFTSLPIWFQSPRNTIHNQPWLKLHIHNRLKSQRKNKIILCFFQKKQRIIFLKQRKNLTSKQNILITFAKKYFS